MPLRDLNKKRLKKIVEKFDQRQLVSSKGATSAVSKFSYNFGAFLFWSDRVFLFTFFGLKKSKASPAGRLQEYKQ